MLYGEKECSMPLFTLDQKVVYPAHGVARVVEIIERTVGGTAMKFYKLSFLYKDMTILIPVEGSSQTGVRPLSSIAQIDEAIACMGHVEKRPLHDIDINPSGWNKRQKDYQLRIQSGDFKVVLDIYQELMFISQQKELSFGEKGLLHTTEELLVQELVVVKAIDRSQAVEILRAPFKEFYFMPHSTLRESALQ